MFLHGVRVVGPDAAEPSLRPRSTTSTPYLSVWEHVSCNISTRPPIQPTCLDINDVQVPHVTTESRQSYCPAAPIQRFNNITLNWSSWFRHFKAVADIHGWNKKQHALQLVSYLDETAMNVVQELADEDLYNYYILV